MARHPAKTRAYKDSSAQQLRSFCETARLGSFAAAAAHLGLANPTVWNQVRALEREFGEALFERHGRGSRLTEAGEVLAARAAQALSSLGAAEEELDALAGLQTGTIHLGSSTAPGVYLLPDTLGCFRREHPGITVEVV